MFCLVTSFGASCMVSWNCSMHLCKRNVGGASYYQYYCSLLALVVLLSDLLGGGVRGCMGKDNDSTDTDVV